MEDLLLMNANNLFKKLKGETTRLITLTPLIKRLSKNMKQTYCNEGYKSSSI